MKTATEDSTATGCSQLWWSVQIPIRLIDDISQRWRESPIEPELWEQFRAAWRQNGEQIPPLPEEPRGFWFYRDRFQEQYGKKCEFNPVLQNCTFALMDTEQGRLYVLETDF